MAAELSQDAVLLFLHSRGGSAKNSDLLLHFNHFIRNNVDRDRNRELFKKFVNTVATVRQDDGVSYVVLRKKFRGQVPAAAAPAAGGRSSAAPPRLPRSTEPSPEPPPENSYLRATTIIKAASQGETTVLPAAGIILNINAGVDFNQKVTRSSEPRGGTTAAPEKIQISEHHVRHECTSVGQQSLCFGPLPGTTVVDPVVREHGGTRLLQDVPAVREHRGTRLLQDVPAVREQGGTRLLQDVPAVREHGGTRLLQDVPAVREHGGTRLLQDVPAVREHGGTRLLQDVPAVREHGGTRLLQDVPAVREHGGTRLLQDVPAVREHGGTRLLQDVPAVREHGGTRLLQDVPAVREQGGTRLLQDVPAVREHGGTRLLQDVPAVREHGGTRLLQDVPAVREHGGTRLLQDVPAVREHGGTRLLQDVPAVREQGGTRLLQDVPAVREHGGTRLLQDVPAVREHGGTRLLQDVPAVREHGGTRQKQVLVPQTLQSREAGLHQAPPPVSSVAPRRFRYRQSYKTAVSQDDDEDEEEEEVTVRCGSAGGVWPSMVPLEDSRRNISVSSPCIIESPAPPSVTSSSSSSERMPPRIFIHDVEEETLHPRESGVELGHMSSRQRWPSETERYTSSPDQERRFSQDQGVHLEPRPLHSQAAILSSGHSSVFSPSSDAGFSSSDWPPSSTSRGSAWNCSYEDLQAPEAGTTILEALQRAQRTNLTGAKPTAGRLHDNQDSSLHVVPWHLSTGDLYDDHEEAESSEGSPFSSLMQHPLVTRRLNSRTRDRMCRSLGADLDQLLQEEARGGGGGGGSEAARLNRLHLLSSSLSLRYTLSSSSLSSCSSPPRCQSLGNLVEGVDRGGGGGGASLPTATPTAHHHESSSRQSLVPLEPREHDWLVKGASGAWPDIYSLFREEPSLLNKQDFMSGFTVLHWIAKHGDHRVLNTLWYGVQKSGLMFDVNARSMCGHTPLHIAAIHSNKNIMQLLVNKFEADVKLRDTAGKRPWQYLSGTAPLDVFQMLGAPARAALGGVKRADGSWDHHQQQQQQQQRRRRRHHFSTASSGQRPLTIAGTIRVKRSSSIAALLKHKSLRRFHVSKSDSSF
ncbi:uncharacterized protein LOC131446519 [Solea solea]|uniref:uncharacterized protein LOC131446519 n=1 Tax=Solea solea TaxID=90069 RepID=UPI00272BB795|nr:uncharacterized protein LOC131446519 [Solea solea]